MRLFRFEGINEEGAVLKQFRSKGFGIAAAAVVALGVSSAHAACTSQKDMAAYHMRQLQTDLMVASLNCNLHDRYNAFVDRFNPELTRNGKHLKVSFRERFGATAKSELNAYVTTLANMSSLDSIQAGAKYCKNSAKAFDKILTISHDEIEDFANAWWDTKRQVPESDCRYSLHIASNE